MKRHSDEASDGKNGSKRSKTTVYAVVNSFLTTTTRIRQRGVRMGLGSMEDITMFEEEHRAALKKVRNIFHDPTITADTPLPKAPPLDRKEQGHDPYIRQRRELAIALHRAGHLTIRNWLRIEFLRQDQKWYKMGPSDIAYDYEQNRSNNSKPVVPEPVPQKAATDVLDTCLNNLLRKCGKTVSFAEMERVFVHTFQRWKPHLCINMTDIDTLFYLRTSSDVSDIRGLTIKMRGYLKHNDDPREVHFQV